MDAKRYGRPGIGCGPLVRGHLWHISFTIRAPTDHSINQCKGRSNREDPSDNRRTRCHKQPSCNAAEHYGEYRVCNPEKPRAFFRYAFRCHVDNLGVAGVAEGGASRFLTRPGAFAQRNQEGNQHKAPCRDNAQRPLCTPSYGEAMPAESDGQLKAPQGSKSQNPKREQRLFNIFALAYLGGLFGAGYAQCLHQDLRMPDERAR